MSPLGNVHLLIQPPLGSLCGRPFIGILCIVRKIKEREREGRPRRITEGEEERRGETNTVDCMKTSASLLTSPLVPRLVSVMHACMYPFCPLNTLNLLEKIWKNKVLIKSIRLIVRINSLY